MPWLGGKVFILALGEVIFLVVLAYFIDNLLNVLENTRIGKNLLNFRRVREKKASEVAKHIGISEAAYTKYERGESQITISLIQKVAEFLEVDPLQLISASPSNFFQNVHNSPILSNFQTFQTTNDEQAKLMLKLMESMVALNERLIALLDKKEKS
jgi:transcriptional regulator with XRE-family HTH domain